MTEAGEQTTAQRRTWRKAAHKPKHPLNAYNVFFQFERERILNHQSHAPIDIEEVAKIRISLEKKKRRKGKQKQLSANGVKVGFADLARTIASKWKQLDDEARAAFEKHAEQDKIRYKQELEQWAQNRAKGEEGDDAAQLDDGSILSLGTPLMEDETVAPQPISPQMFHAKAEVEVPRTIAFEKKGKEQQDTQQTHLGLGEFSSQTNDANALQDDSIRPSMVTPPQEQVAMEGQNGVSSSMLNQEEEMRKMLQHHTREMNLIASRLYEMENNRISQPPHNNLGGGPTCCAACMSKSASVNSFQNPNMFPQMGNMNMGMNMGPASLQVMQNNNMMCSPAGFNSFGPNPTAAGFAWDAVAMQSGGMPAGNGFDFPSSNNFPSNGNGQVNGGAWTGSNNNLEQTKGLNFPASGAWDALTAEAGPRRISM